jgi:predicted RNase H-related nuclease YkuK (DUF458 family)
MSISGRSLELFFVDGRPDGMLTAEVFDWTGHVLRFPRTQIKEALFRPEAEHTGVYVLLGEKDGSPFAYIGEGEEVRSRLKDHVQKKDWWETAVIITTSSNKLHKAHVKYLESRLVEIARDVGAIGLENGNTPPRSSLSEASVANMEAFLETLMMVLPAIRVDMFLSKKRSKQNQTEVHLQSGKGHPTFELSVPKNNVHAFAKIIDGEMVVQAGSKVRPTWAGDRKKKTHYYLIHDELVAKGIIQVQGEYAELVTDYAFTSPSAAGAICTGRSTNGRTSWQLKGTNTTYAEWEEQQLEDTE